MACVNTLLPRYVCDASNAYRSLQCKLSVVVIQATADMVAGWQALGFCHGVLNTDNFTLLGLALDFGPCRSVPIPFFCEVGLPAAHRNKMVKFDHCLWPQKEMVWHAPSCHAQVSKTCTMCKARYGFKPGVDQETHSKSESKAALSKCFLSHELMLCR